MAAAGAVMGHVIGKAVKIGLFDGPMSGENNAGTAEAHT